MPAGQSGRPPTEGGKRGYIDLDTFCYRFLHTGELLASYEIAGGAGDISAATSYLNKESTKRRLGDLAYMLWQQMGEMDRQIVATVRTEIWNMITLNMGDLVDIEGDKVRIKDWENLSRHHKGIIQELQPTKYGLKIKTYSRLEAMRMMAQLYELAKNSSQNLPVVEMRFSRTYQGDQDNERLIADAEKLFDSGTKQLGE